jgi:HSP20 family protein
LGRLKKRKVAQEHLNPIPLRKNLMNALTKWDPFRTMRWDPVRELDEFSSRLSSFFGRSPLKTDDERADEYLTYPEWSPAVDITEDDHEYLIKADLPEIRKEAIKVTVENGVLMISGERKREQEEKGRRYHRVERSYGSFVRSFTLPDDADGAKLSAEFKDGILKVHLPKTENAKRKAIEVKVQ